MNVPPCFEDPEAAELIRDVSDKHNVDKQLLMDICEIAINNSGKGRANGIDVDISNALSRYIESPERNQDVSS